ncbi:MAG: BMP family ABC transporter substrate-binding protein [Clostridiales bacterium]|nr:BMP family ABC transporter substrate-binding protein [Clostridiales bacterium]
MRKLLALVLILALALPVFALAEGTYEIAMVTDLGTIDDKSFNQGSWEGIVAYAEANGKTYHYYQPSAQSTDIYLDFIEQAVNGGAKVIVTPGYLFEVPVFKAQDMYPDVHFILIDGNPNDGDLSLPEFRTEQNAVGIVFAEEQAGFLAGYAAVKDGYTKLGFMGGMAVPAVVRFGYGFVQGAEMAAAEMDIKDLVMNYHYTGGFAATPEAQALAASWYANGIEVVFACGGAVGDSVMAAAEAADGKVIGVDVDQSSQSETILTSAAKGLASAVEQTLAAFYAGEFPGGQALVKDAKLDGVELPMATSRFKTFSQADYDAIFAKLVADEIKLLKDSDAPADAKGSPEFIPVERMTVTEIK